MRRRVWLWELSGKADHEGRQKRTGKVDRNPGNNVREYPIVRGGAQVQDFGGGALGALYGGGLKAGANLAMKAAGYLAKSPKTAKIAHSIQNFVKGGSKPKDYSNIRASWNGPTTVGARKNYNNVGSN